MKQFSYQQDQANHTLFVKLAVDRRKSILIAYVDDMILTSDNIWEIDKLKGLLQSKFKVKDQGKLQYFFGIEIVRRKKGIFISQKKYILDPLKQIRKPGCKLAATSLERNQKYKITRKFHQLMIKSTNT